MDDNTSLYAVFDLIGRKNDCERKIKDLQDEAEGLKKEIRGVCRHPKGFVEEKERYLAGDGYSPPRTEYWDECMLCGWHVETGAIYHSRSE